MNYKIENSNRIRYIFEDLINEVSNDKKALEYTGEILNAIHSESNYKSEVYDYISSAFKDDIVLLKRLGMTDYLEDFKLEFDRQYQFLYKNNENTIAGYSEALDYFNSGEMTEHEKRILKNFTEYREDYIISDKEVVAFLFTYDKLYS